jgi:methyl-accepting chemotaxis protein
MGLPSFKIAQKLPLALVGSALVVGLGIGMAAYFIGLNTVNQQSEQRMDASVKASVVQVTEYLKAVDIDLRMFSARADTVAAIENFARSYSELAAGSDPVKVLHSAYIDKNPNPVGEKQLLDTSGGMAGTYDGQHKRYHPGFRTLLTERGYYDVFLFDTKGNLVYSVFKEPDFATNFVDGQWADSGLGRVFRAAKDKPAGEIAFEDFSSYAPSNGVPASFAGVPVYKNDTLVGVLALQISTKGLSDNVANAKGLGATGEVVIVGPDNLLRSDSKFSSDGDVLKTEFKADVITAALAGADSVGMGKYRDASAVVAAAPFTYHDTKWAIAAAQSEAEVMAPVNDMRNGMLAVGGILLAVAAVVGLLFSRSISKPLTDLTDTMAALAEGNLEREVKGAKGKDELGAMARAVEVFRANGLQMRDMTEEERHASEQRRADRVGMMQDLQRAFGQVVDAAIAGDFTQRVTTRFPDEELNRLAASVNNLVETVDRGVAETGQVLAALAQTDLTLRMEGDYEGSFAKLKADTNAVADRLTDIVGQLKATSGALKTATGEILSGANDLSERTTKQAAAIEETSAAVEQLANAVADNARKAEDAAVKTQSASQLADEGGKVMADANVAMERITTSSAKISNIIGMIDDIAFQTNLLALNASVEAARAGESGKGFAVVAIEVRRLAQSAAQASSEVKVLIEQSASEVKGGSRLVSDAAGKLGAILASVQENAVLMHSISVASREQSSSIQEVTTAIRQMDEMTQHNAALVEQTNAAIEQTEAQASELDRVVDVFTIADNGQGRRAPGRVAMPEMATGIRGLQQRVKTAAKSYLSKGNTALDKDWSEF